ncbi:hypothetical protein BHF71_10010 [Vulcanibacillus modesticaldus]|uniref:Helix-turn-helix domain-containing protein n=1 Tax=Vulcanibacillus modesticaldus TaxID=337097 RepID=A0A1D2YTZ8_9BACI|nr:hypothetical protein BHF71_10010 [Vulcanibacillus modesticaldus]
MYEALDILKKYYITESKQMVTRWIRQNKIKAIRTDNRKQGWEIDEEDLYAFIETLRPGLRKIYQEIEKLKQENKMLKEISKKVIAEVELKQLSFDDFEEINTKKKRGKYGKITPSLLKKVFFASNELKYFSETERDYKFREFYNLFFENGKLKPELFDTDKNVYICPVTYIAYDYPKPLIKNAVKEFLEPRLF